MAQLGMWSGVVDLTHTEEGGQKKKGGVVSGLVAFLIWRSAYWTKVRIHLVSMSLCGHGSMSVCRGGCVCRAYL